MKPFRLPRKDRPQKVLVLGSGALQIGQAGEFDYSGSQALKALREEGIQTVLINPNIATIQTSSDLADAVYLLPVEPEFVEQIIIKEKIDGILLSFGGQTALNCGLALDDAGTFKKHNVRVLGTPTRSIRLTEDRKLFNDELRSIGVSVAKSHAVTTVEEAVVAAESLGYPIILRAGFSLGGKGSAFAYSTSEIRDLVARALIGTGQVLIEECLLGWKELEYEVVRDASDNAITVCNMENIDPMGIHTGESIVVAPTQTLDDKDHQMLRDVALKTIRHLGIVGECNIQYALSPSTGEYRVIEVNARLSRSSALASKATGYPLAYVAAKIAVGYELHEIPNGITHRTTAFFEPALDYIVVKIPRWDFDKFPGVDRRLGPEMKSVGEIMAVGRNLPEALQKGMRMLEQGPAGLSGGFYEFPDLKAELQAPTPRRLFAVIQALKGGMSIAELHELTKIDPFFLMEMGKIACAEMELDAGVALAELDAAKLRKFKALGFADRTIAASAKCTVEEVAKVRSSLGVVPHLAKIDTLAAEYPARSNYMYLTYAAAEHETAPVPNTVLVLGSGCYRIGSSVEFDWCCVSAVEACRELGYHTVLANCNPETVSTDYDVCDTLVFDELTLETVLELVAALKPIGVVVSVGGQTSNNLALKLHAAGVPILGTRPESIDSAEDRNKFSALCDQVGVDQPRWRSHDSMATIDAAIAEMGGFPVIVRPSYVLSGAAMRVAHKREELVHFLQSATSVSPEHPVVFSKFEENAREIEFDGVAKDGEILHFALSEHVENAGVHSGDATLMMPPQSLTLETIRKARRISETLTRKLNVTGPINIQMLARHNVVKVIEVNLRASRSFPFVSKVLGVNFVREAARAMLGAPRHANAKDPLDLDFVAVKAAKFSFRRLPGVDPVLGVEMASTGEVGCFGHTAGEALLKAMLSVGFKVPQRGVLLSLGPMRDKYRFRDEAVALRALGLALYATAGTAQVLADENIPCTVLAKEAGQSLPFAVDVIRSGAIDLVINIPREYSDSGVPDGYFIRRGAIDLEVPLITDLPLARALIRAMATEGEAGLKVLPMHAYRAN
jgi:carbamoyl-phosphate synthase large subunit